MTWQLQPNHTPLPYPHDKKRYFFNIFKTSYRQSSLSYWRLDLALWTRTHWTVSPLHSKLLVIGTVRGQQTLDSSELLLSSIFSLKKIFAQVYKKIDSNFLCSKSNIILYCRKIHGTCVLTLPTVLRHCTNKGSGQEAIHASSLPKISSPLLWCPTSSTTLLLLHKYILQSLNSGNNSLVPCKR